MKNKTKKLWNIIAIAAIIGFSFAACGGNEEETDGGKDDLLSKVPTAGDGSFTTLTDITIVDETSAGAGAIDFTKGRFFGDTAEFSEYLEGVTEVKIVNNKLSIKLGTPKIEKLVDAADDGYGFGSEGVDITEGLQIFRLRGFYTDDYSLSCGWEEEIGSFYSAEGVEFVYANKDGIIFLEETFKEDGWEGITKFDMRLKEGWNTIIGFEFADEEKMIAGGGAVSGKPAGKHKWILKDQ